MSNASNKATLGVQTASSHVSSSQKSSSSRTSGRPFTGTCSNGPRTGIIGGGASGPTAFALSNAVSSHLPLSTPASTISERPPPQAPQDPQGPQQDTPYNSRLPDQSLILHVEEHAILYPPYLRAFLTEDSPRRHDEDRKFCLQIRIKRPKPIHYWLIGILALIVVGVVVGVVLGVAVHV